MPKEKPKKSNSEYSAKSIQVLEGLEPVRKRPGMYIGGTSIEGLHHLIWEVVNNSIDEAMAGHCRNIVVELLPDNLVRVEDDGRGIPVEKHPQTKVSTLETVMTKLHAGGKFDHRAYKVSGGLHGVGVSVVNALSEWLEVEVRRDGKIHHQEYEKGRTASKLKVIGSAKNTGTRVTFKADEEIFGKGKIVYSFDTLCNRLRELAFLNKNVRITLKDERVKAARADSPVWRALDVILRDDSLGPGASLEPVVVGMRFRLTSDGRACQEIRCIIGAAHEGDKKRDDAHALVHGETS